VTCDRLFELHPSAHKGLNKQASALSRRATDTEIPGHALLQVLKFVTCDRLFELHPSAHEGRLALRKDAIVSNVALGRKGLALGLPSRLTAPFRYSPDIQPKTFMSEVYLPSCRMWRSGGRGWRWGRRPVARRLSGRGLLGCALWRCRTDAL